MKKLLPILLTCFTATVNAQTKPLLANYNSQYYPTVIDAAVGVAYPFLLQQQNKTMTGVTVQGNSLVYQGVKYGVNEKYENPDPGYYIASSSYAAYGIPKSLAATWPQQMPNAVYNSSNKLFNATIDCVGYGSRLLSVTGDSNHNAYTDLRAYINTHHVSHFAAPGYVATAFEFAVGFPTLPASIQHGWQYVSGNVMPSGVQNSGYPGFGSYSAASKGGFAASRPGDILAFGYTKNPHSNGHFMVFEASPVLLNSGTIVNYIPASNAQLNSSVQQLLQQYKVYAVPVYDCSGQKAHFNDSRQKSSGIGFGTLLVLTDKVNDIPQGFIFKGPPATNTTVGAELMSNTHLVALTVGRYNP